MTLRLPFSICITSSVLQKPDIIAILKSGICIKYLFLTKKISFFRALLIKLGDFLKIGTKWGPNLIKKSSKGTLIS